MEYTIQQVSERPPRAWSFTNKQTNQEVKLEAYKVMLSGVPDVVEVNKPAGTKPQVGDVLTGTLEDSDFGKKFKAEKKQFTGGRGNYQPRDDASIKAQFAIKTAVQAYGKLDIQAGVINPRQLDDIEALANELYVMVDRVKNYKTDSQEPLPDRPGDIQANGGFGQDQVVADFPDEPINLDDIPF